MANRVMSKINVGSVGDESHGDVAGTQSGGSAAEARGSTLKAAVSELHSQHPQKYDDHGPHHNTTDHIRHSPAVRPR